MWGRNSNDDESEYTPVLSSALRDAMRRARIESAEQASVVVDLRDAELARLELLNEGLDTLFEEIPSEVQLFDRGISQGDTPRLWIDSVSHVVMGRDKRHYRFVMDGRYGRKLLAESTVISEMVDAVTRYVAGRLIERERALTDNSLPFPGKAGRGFKDLRAHRRWSMMRMFIFGLIVGSLALFVALWIMASRIAAPATIQ
jgi:hypothetical protein